MIHSWYSTYENKIFLTNNELKSLQENNVKINLKILFNKNFKFFFSSY